MLLSSRGILVLTIRLLLLRIESSGGCVCVVLSACVSAVWAASGRLFLEDCEVPSTGWLGGGLAGVVVGRTLGCVEGGGHLGCRGHVIAIGVGCSSDRRL